MLGYGVSFLLIVNDRLQLNLPRVYGWLLGGITVSAWSQLLVIGPLIVLTALASLRFGRSLNALSLGEEMAEQLGVPIEREKLLLIVASSLLVTDQPSAFVGCAAKPWLPPASASRR